jgi:hypothetical protein
VPSARIDKQGDGEGGDFDEEQFDYDDHDLDNTGADTLTSSDEAIRIKFLNCVAELLSHTKGWHHRMPWRYSDRRRSSKCSLHLTLKIPQIVILMDHCVFWDAALRSFRATALLSLPPTRSRV